MGTRGSDEESIGDLFGRLVEDTKAYGRAEADYYRALTTQRLAEARAGLVMAGLAVVLALAAAIALIVGLVLTLATLIGPGLATLAVVVVTLAVAGLLGWMAAKHLRRVFGARP